MTEPQHREETRAVDTRPIGEPPRVLLGVPLNDERTHTEFAIALRGLDCPPGTELSRANKRHTAIMRNDLCQEALDGGFSHLYMVDTDMVYPPGALLTKLAADVPVICGLALMRTPPHIPIFSELHEDRWKWSSVWPTDNKRADGVPMLGVQRTGVVGGAGLLIRRDVLEAIEPPWFSFSAIADDGCEVGEDVFFTQACHDAGFETYCHCGVPIGHLQTAEIKIEMKFDEAGLPERFIAVHEGVGPFWVGPPTEEERARLEEARQAQEQAGAGNEREEAA